MDSVPKRLSVGREESIEDLPQKRFQAFLCQQAGLKMAFENQAGKDWPNGHQRALVILFPLAGKHSEHFGFALGITRRLGHFKRFAEPAFRFRMAQRIELELESKNRPNPIFSQADEELSKSLHLLLSGFAGSEAGNEAFDISAGSMFKEGKEQVFLALEVGVDSPFAAVCQRRNLIQLGSLVAIANEDFFGGVQEPGLGFLGPKLLFTRSLHGTFLHLTTIPQNCVDKKPTGQYVSPMTQAVLQIEPFPREEKKSSAKRIAVAGLAALLACAGATGWGVYTHGFETTDDAQVDGHLNVVSSRIGATTAAVYVTDNQMIEAGQPLVDLDPSEQKVAYAQAKAQYDQAVAQLNAQRPSIAITQADNAASSVTADVGLAEAKAAYAAASQDLAGAAAKLAESEAIQVRDEAQLQRYQKLYDAGTISRQNYEQAVAAAHSSDASSSAAKAAVASAEKVVDERKEEIAAQTAKREQLLRTAPRQLSIREADLENAQANVELAAAQLQRAALNVSFCHIVSPVRGIVTQRTAEIGNRVSEAQPLMMIVASGDTWVTANFKETQLARMHAGQRVTVHVDALKSDFAGTVDGVPAVTGARSSVLPPENATGNYIKVVQRMPVRIRLNASQADADRLRPGMSVEAKVWLR